MAYAHVLWNGTTASLDPPNTAGMGSATVTKRFSSAFCFGNLPFTAHNATATVDLRAALTNDEIAQVEIDPPGTTASDCQPGENVEVATDDLHSGASPPVSFYITFN